MKKNIETKFHEIFYHYLISVDKKNYDGETRLLQDLLITELDTKYPSTAKNIHRFKRHVTPIIKAIDPADTMLALALYLEHKTIKPKVDVIYQKIKSKIVNMPKIIAPALFYNGKKYLPGQLYLIYVHSFMKDFTERLTVFEKKLERQKNNKDRSRADVRGDMSQVKATLDLLSKAFDTFISFQIHLDYIPVLSDKTCVLYEGIRNFCEQNRSYKHIKSVQEFQEIITPIRRDLILAAYKLNRSVTALVLLDILPPIISRYKELFRSYKGFLANNKL